MSKTGVASRFGDTVHSSEGYIMPFVATSNPLLNLRNCFRNLNCMDAHAKYLEIRDTRCLSEIGHLMHTRLLFVGKCPSRTNNSVLRYSVFHIHDELPVPSKQVRKGGSKPTRPSVPGRRRRQP